MGKEEIGKLVDDSKKALEKKHATKVEQIKSDLANLKKTTLSGVK